MDTNSIQWPIVRCGSDGCDSKFKEVAVFVAEGGRLLSEPSVQPFKGEVVNGLCRRCAHDHLRAGVLAGEVSSRALLDQTV